MSQRISPADSESTLRARWRRIERPATAAAVGAITIYLCVRLYRLIDAHAVNVFFYDQWVYTWALLKEPGRTVFATGTLRASHPTADPALLAPFPGPLPEIGGFFAQMATWYQGLGGIVTELVYGFSRWNTRAESFTIYALMVLAMCCALALKVRLFGPLRLSDAVIPLVFMTPHQVETFLAVMYAAHAALPILLTILFCFCWLIRRPLVRYAALLVMNFLTTFTGHGFLLGALAPALFALDAISTARRGDRRAAVLPLICVPVAVGTLALWWVPQVQFVTVFSCFTFPHYPLTDYLWFIGRIFRRMLGFTPESVAGLRIGALAALALVAVCLRQLWVIWRRRLSPGSPEGAVLILAGFTLVFCVSVAVGRVCNPESAGSRYSSLLIPGFVACYLAVLRIEPHRFRTVAATVYAAVILASVFPVSARDWHELQGFRLWKRLWVDCYLETRSVTQCDARTPSVCPAEIAVQLDWQLRELERRKLSFFAVD